MSGQPSIAGPEGVKLRGVKKLGLRLKWRPPTLAAIARGDQYMPALIVYLSVALAVIAAVVRYLAYTGKELPQFPTGGFLLLLAAYLLLLAGILFGGG